MEQKFTTVNNWVCKTFIQALAIHNYRQCCFLMYNTFDECLSDEVKNRMHKYFLDSIRILDVDAHRCLWKSLPLDVRYYVIKLFSNYVS